MRPGIDLNEKRVLVVGVARSGIASALFCAAHGARVTATDEKPEANLAEAAAKLRAAGVALALGAHGPDLFTSQDFIILSPGVPADLSTLAAARVKGIRVWSEIELAWRFLHGRMIAVTGSNGKTTTTSLIAHILKSAGISTAIGGNIGTPLISLVDFTNDTSFTVAEVSSFQLETIESFRPEIALLLNLTPDHLDRHHSIAEYARAKLRIFENQRERDAAILNADDPEVAQRVPAKLRAFTGSAGRSTSPPALTSATRKSSSATTARKKSFFGAMKFPCAAITMSKMFSPHLSPHTSPAPNQPPSPKASAPSRASSIASNTSRKSAA